MNKSIDINTTQNVTIEYELASLYERVGAWLLDALIIGLGYGVFAFLTFSAFGDYLTSESGIGWGLFLWLLFFLFFFGYHFLFEILNAGQTLGKAALNLKVVRLDGREADWSDVLIRSSLYLVDALATGGIVGMLLIKTTVKSQRLGDMAANTTVIKVLNQSSRFSLREILNISTIEQYQPVYPQVRQLTEKDMIFIKTTLNRYHRYGNMAHAEAIDELAIHLQPLLGIEKLPNNRVEFLRTLLRDYIVLTR